MREKKRRGCTSKTLPPCPSPAINRRLKIIKPRQDHENDITFLCLWRCSMGKKTKRKVTSTGHPSQRPRNLAAPRAECVLSCRGRISQSLRITTKGSRLGYTNLPGNQSKLNNIRQYLPGQDYTRRSGLVWRIYPSFFMRIFKETTVYIMNKRVLTYLSNEDMN